MLLLLYLAFLLLYFSVSLINDDENFNSLLNILFGILLIAFAINPWASGACIKLAIQNN